MKKLISLLCIATLLPSVSGCGYLLYPERKGQTSGRIDPGVAVLDGVGLLLFIIPGVIAYAVDFSTGTIYYPSGHRSSLENTDITQMTALHVGKEHLSPDAIHETIFSQTGVDTQAPGVTQHAYRLAPDGTKRPAGVDSL